MNARYIVRFDDLCPSMDWEIWDKVESILNQYHIKPIIAVVPDNKDPELMPNPPRDDFWEKVKRWQAAGWTIALHGYQHLYSTKHSGLIQTNSYSEFVGLPYEKQLEKIKLGLEIFQRHGIRADAWIAPAHSFDELTIKALLECGINVISDGYYFRPVKRLGAVWVPQQLWRFRKMRWGLWTICFHHNDIEDFLNFSAHAPQFASSIISFDQALKDYPAKPYSALDKLTERLWRILFWIKSLRRHLNQG
jgi:predicted deacetylase